MADRYKGAWEESEKRGGGRDDALERLFGNRMGQRGRRGGGGGGGGRPNLGRGHDGHPTRATHIRVRPITGGNLPAYILREGPSRDDDLEAAGGLPAEAMKARILRLEADIAADRSIARDKRGRKPAAAYELGFDLPLDSTPATRRLSVERVAEAFEDRNFDLTWAIHNKDGHPHCHLLIVAGDRGRRPVDGGQEMMRVRDLVATTINRTHLELIGSRLEVEFSGKTLRALGVDRPQRPDIPTALYRARERRDSGRPGRGKGRQDLAAGADRIEGAWKADVAAFEAGQTVVPRSKVGLQSRATEAVAAWAEKAARETPPAAIGVPPPPARVEITIDVETPGGVLRRSTIEKRVVDAKPAWQQGRDAGIGAGEAALSEERRRAEAALVAAKSAIRAAEQVARERPHTRTEIDHLLLQERRKAQKAARERHERTLAEQGVVPAQRAQADLAIETARRLAAEEKADRLERQLAEMVRDQQSAAPRPSGSGQAGTGRADGLSGFAGFRSPVAPPSSPQNPSAVRTESPLPRAMSSDSPDASPRQAVDPDAVPTYRSEPTSEAEGGGATEKTYPEMPPLQADGGDRSEVAEARRLASGYSNDQLIGAILATRRARDLLNDADTTMGRYDRKTLVAGLTIAFQEVSRRDIKIPPEGKSTGQVNRGPEKDSQR